jgi:hypothetical protein
MCEETDPVGRRSPGSKQNLSRRQAEHLFGRAEPVLSGLEQDARGLTIRLVFRDGQVLSLHYDSRTHRKKYEWTSARR